MNLQLPLMFYGIAVWSCCRFRRRNQLGLVFLEKGKVVFVADEPTGGTHMTLVLAGSYGVDFETAEDIKTDKKKEKEVFVQITPVLQKMASIVKKIYKRLQG